MCKHMLKCSIASFCFHVHPHDMVSWIVTDNLKVIVNLVNIAIRERDAHVFWHKNFTLRSAFGKDCLVTKSCL